MNEKSLEKNLANMERELINLQTAHDVGIGVVKFYKYGEYTEHWFPLGVYGRIVLVLFEASIGENPNPMIQTYTDMITVETIKSSTLPNRYALYYYFSSDWGNGITWELVSSSLINWHYANSIQDAENWLGEPL